MEATLHLASPFRKTQQKSTSRRFTNYTQVDWSLIQRTSLSSPTILLTSHVHSEAKIEFGETFASKLKLSRDGTKVLWPQPTDSPRDPQNWNDARKSIHLFIVTLASIIPDFDSGIGEDFCLAIFGLTSPRRDCVYLSTGRAI